MKNVLPMAGTVVRGNQAYAMVKCETNEEWLALPQEAEIDENPCKKNEWNSVSGICLYTIAE